MGNLLDLPPELVSRILLHLSRLEDLACCQLTNSFLHLIITNSVQIQYRLAKLIAGVESNDQIQLGINDRIECLKSIERGWDQLTFEFSRETPLAYGTFTRTVMDGFYFSTRRLNKRSDSEEIRYFKLPSTPEADIGWNKIYVKNGVVAIAVAVYEHDLLAVATL